MIKRQVLEEYLITHILLIKSIGLNYFVKVFVDQINSDNAEIYLKDSANGQMVIKYQVQKRNSSK